MNDEVLKLDHIIYGGPCLNDLAEFVKKRLGIEPQYGGGHPQLGTHNSLVRLDNGAYLELISPDPSNQIEGGVTVLGIGNLSQPKIVGWAMQTLNLEALKKKINFAGIETTEVFEGHRNKPDGELVKYKTLFLSNANFEIAPMIEPFFIEWITDSPAIKAPGGYNLVSWKATHPEPGKYAELFKILGFDFEISVGERPELQLKLHYNDFELILS